MNASTVVRRTDAGTAELATPAHGLSLAQRRFLTLLDTARSVGELAQAQPPDKLERDLARLTLLGLVACATPAPANDPVATDAANAPMRHAPAAVRLGISRGARRAAVLAAAIAAATAAWLGWQATDGPAPIGATPRGAKTANATVAPSTDRAIVDPVPIATRVLRGDPGERGRDPGRAQPRSAEAHREGVAPAPVAPPHEPRSAPLGDGIDPSLARAPIPLPASAPAPALLPMPVAPAPTMPDASVAAIPAAAPAAPDAAAAKEAPLRVASAAPGGPARPAPPAALVPLVREAPSFPREAVAAGLANGLVKARITIDAKGNVANVDIVEASHRTFNRAVLEALAHWRFEPGAAGRTTIVDVAFKRD